MNDYSFLRLLPDFNKAKSESLPALATIGYFNQIQLSTTGTYLQITTTPEGIAFDGNYNVFIVDCDGNHLKDITSNVAISEFTDNNGVQQIAFEITYINQDFYYKTVFLKFVHTVSDYVWYSNAILISDYKLEETTRFDYRGFTEFNGIAYNNADFFQSIRLRCRFELNDSESTSGQYTTFDGLKVTSRLIETEFEKYIFEEIDNFTYRRLNKLLSHQVIYVNGNRITDKQTIASSEREGDTNLFNIEFKSAINYKETFTPAFQIHDELALTFYAPFGNYTLAGLPLNIFGQFNRNISLITGGSIDLIDNSDDSIIQTFTGFDITVLSNTISCDITGLITVNGSYKVRINGNTFLSVFNETFPAFEWNFTVSNPDFLAADFDNDDFFTS